MKDALRASPLLLVQIASLEKAVAYQFPLFFGTIPDLPCLFRAYP
jgi:hypothetical protein